VAEDALDVHQRRNDGGDIVLRKAAVTIGGLVTPTLPTRLVLPAIYGGFEMRETAVA